MPISNSLEKARERAKQMGLPYDGALTPQEAFEMLRQTPGAKLVDVRTRAELDWVGRIPGAVEIELLSYPGSRPNSEFLKQLEAQVDKSTPVLFICRSGARSHNAALMATQAGYTEATTCSKASKAIKTRPGIGIREAGGGWPVSPGFRADSDAPGSLKTRSTQRRRLSFISADAQRDDSRSGS